MAIIPTTRNLTEDRSDLHKGPSEKCHGGSRSTVSRDKNRCDYFARQNSQAKSKTMKSTQGLSSPITKTMKSTPRILGPTTSCLRSSATFTCQQCAACIL